VCREGADRAIDDVEWVGCVFLLGGLAQDACCCGRHSPFTVRPPLSCCKIIFTVLDHAAAGAGGRRLQEERVLNRGNPNATNLPKRLMLPKFPASWALPVVPACAAELPQAMALADMPLDLVQHALFL
jgi:hypothetical protein